MFPLPVGISLIIHCHILENNHLVSGPGKAWNAHPESGRPSGLYFFLLADTMVSNGRTKQRKSFIYLFESSELSSIL